MKKFTFLFAALMASAAMFAESSAKVELLWKNDALSAINSGDHARDMDYYNGKLYVMNKNDKKVYTLDAATGALDETAIAFDYFTGYSVCVDNAGNILATEGAWGMTNCLKMSKVVDGTPTYLNSTTTATNRIDYLDVYGDIESEEGAIVVGANTNNADIVAVWSMKNGGLVNAAEPVLFSDVRGAFGTNSDVCIVSKTAFWTNSASGSVKPTLFTMNDDLSMKDVKTVNVMCADGGISAFTIDYKEYIAVVVTKDEKKVLTIYDVTDPAAATEVVAATDELTGTSTHKGIEAVVEDGVATIYVWCPNANALAYKFTPAAPAGPTAVENTTVAVKAQKIIRNGQVLMVRDGKTFNMMGVEVK